MDMNRGRALSDLGNSLLIGPHQGSGSAMHPTASLFGLVNTSMAVWSCLDDEDGVSYCACREMPAYVSAGGWVMSNASGKGLLTRRESASFWSGSLAIDCKEGGIEWRSADIYRGGVPVLEVSYKDGRGRYREGDFLSLEGEQLWGGYQIYEPTKGQGTTNQVLKAHGVLDGKKVSGVLGFNAHFQKPGMTYRFSPMVAGGQMVMWTDISNFYEDGSWEAGPIMVGLDGNSLVWLTDDKGRMILSYDIDFEMDQDADGYATEMRFSFYDARTGTPHKWIWRCKPGSNMVELPALAPFHKYKRSADGYLVREGETRKLVHGSAWTELQVDDRLSHIPRNGIGRIR